jgi:hypothetical protein
MVASKLFDRGLVILAVVSATLTLVEQAFAVTEVVPAPLVGAGLPGLAVLGGVYGAIWLSRKLRNRR